MKDSFGLLPPEITKLFAATFSEPCKQNDFGNWFLYQNY